MWPLGMRDCLRVLLVHGGDVDVTRMTRALGRLPRALAIGSARDLPSLVTALHGERWDLVMVDGTHASARGVVALVRARGLDVPVIVSALGRDAEATLPPRRPRWQGRARRWRARCRICKK